MVKDTSADVHHRAQVIKAVTHEDVSLEDLGGAMTHNKRQRRGPLCRR
jgi:acetyl-CoA carboxylase carboxyltransferase component